MPGPKRLSWKAVLELARTFPGVEEGTAYGTPAIRVRGRFLARLREDNVSLAIKCGFDERDARLRADPGTFFVTEHYRGYPAVLVRLDCVSRTDLRDVIEQAWRQAAPKRSIREFDSARERSR
jgi:hypothetical protein